MCEPFQLNVFLKESPQCENQGNVQVLPRWTLEKGAAVVLCVLALGTYSPPPRPWASRLPLLLFLGHAQLSGLDPHSEKPSLWQALIECPLFA